MSNYALERPVRRSSERAAGARKIIAPAARISRLARVERLHAVADPIPVADNAVADRAAVVMFS